MSKDQSKIDKFLAESTKFAKDVEDRQPDSGTKPKVSDVVAHFEKNKSEIKIGERTYSIKKFGIRHSMKLIPVLGKSFLVPLSALFKQGMEESEEGMSGITEGLYMLFENIENEMLYAILDMLLENTTVNGTVVSLDEDFDDIADVFQVAVKVLEVNFSGFIKSLGLTELSAWSEALSSFQK